jgi:predicted DNA-binding transcriptional regulator AlpA
MDREQAITDIEAAGRLGLAVATLRQWRYRGRGPKFMRFGRAVRYLPSDLDEFVRESTVTPPLSSQDV